MAKRIVGNKYEDPSHDQGNGLTLDCKIILKHGHEEFGIVNMLKQTKILTQRK